MPYHISIWERSRVLSLPVSPEQVSSAPCTTYYTLFKLNAHCVVNSQWRPFNSVVCFLCHNPIVQALATIKIHGDPVGSLIPRHQLMTHRTAATLLSQERVQGTSFNRTPISNGCATSMVSSLHLWTDIFSTTGIHVSHAQLPEDKEATFLCPRKG